MSEGDSGPERLRKWIDVAAYGGGKLMKGVLPLLGGSVAASELLAPDYFQTIVMSSEAAAVVLSVCAGALVPSLRQKGIE